MTTTHRPIADDELHGAVVMECSLGQFDQQIDALRTEVQILRNLNLSLIDALKAFGDLYLELTDETEQRQFLQRSILRAERQAARLRLPTWFWRPEPGKSLGEMLSWRARFLIHRQRALPDDVWDLIREFVRDHAHQDISDDELAAVIEAARAAEVV